MWEPQSIYSQYVLRSPAMLVGEGAVRGLCSYPSGRVAVIHGSSFMDQELFRSTFKKRDLRFFERGWLGEPDMEGLAGTIRALEEYRPDTIIAIGGGSVIDGAKLCRLLYELPYYSPGKARAEGDLLKTRFIAIPTTVGSGAEASSSAVYVDREKHRKDMVVLHALRPDVVVYDERYVRDSPVGVICASALDAMAHILEGYVSNVRNPMAEAMAEQGLPMLVGELRKLVSGLPQEVKYSRLQYAGYLGGAVQNHCIVGAAHAVAHQLTEYGFSHGEAVSLLLPPVMELNAADAGVREKYRHICGLPGMDGMASFIWKVCGIGGISGRRDELRGLLLSLEGDEAFRDNVRNDRGGKGNPVEITDRYISELIRRA